jgi:hypothetical protein
MKQEKQKEQRGQKRKRAQGLRSLRRNYDTETNIISVVSRINAEAVSRTAVPRNIEGTAAQHSTI